MEILDLVNEIQKYCSMNKIKAIKTTVSELTNHMLIQATENITFENVVDSVVPKIVDEYIIKVLNDGEFSEISNSYLEDRVLNDPLVKQYLNQIKSSIEEIKK